MKITYRTTLSAVNIELQDTDEIDVLTSILDAARIYLSDNKPKTPGYPYGQFYAQHAAAMDRMIENIFDSIDQAEDTPAREKRWKDLRLKFIKPE